MTTETDDRRRRLMLAAGVGVAATGTAGYFGLRHALPSPARGELLAVNVRDLVPGRLRTVEWEGRPVWILRRSAREIAMLHENQSPLVDPTSRGSVQPDGCRNPLRSLRPDIFVAIGLCTHQACTPALRAGEGFLCPCHASKFDLAGRVHRAGPATINLAIPAYRFEGPDRLVLGVDD